MYILYFTMSTSLTCAFPEKSWERGSLKRAVEESRRDRDETTQNVQTERRHRLEMKKWAKVTETYRTGAFVHDKNTIIFNYGCVVLGLHCSAKRQCDLCSTFAKTLREEYGFSAERVRIIYFSMLWVRAWMSSDRDWQYRENTNAKYRLGHPENYLFLLSKYIFRIKVSKKIII